MLLKSYNIHKAVGLLESRGIYIRVDMHTCPNMPLENSVPPAPSL